MYRQIPYYTKAHPTRLHWWLSYLPSRNDRQKRIASMSFLDYADLEFYCNRSGYPMSMHAFVRSYIVHRCYPVSYTHLWGEILNPPADAQVWATYKNEFYEGSPAVTFRKLGKGTITYVGVEDVYKRQSPEYARSFQSHVCSRVPAICPKPDVYKRQILDYMNSDAFRPAEKIAPELIQALFTKVAGDVKSYTKDSPDELKPKIN